MTDDDARYVRGLVELGLGDVPIAGGKGASLGELTSAGARVPPGYVVTTAAYHQVIDVLDADGSLRHAIGELDPADQVAVAERTAAVRAMIEAAPLPADVEAAIRDGYARLGHDGDPDDGDSDDGDSDDGDSDDGDPDDGGRGDLAVAVRSSATSEDSADASFAGLQDTFLWVTGSDAVVAHVRHCWASLYSVESVTYRLHRGVGEDGLAMAVVVQQMVNARSSGVMFTRSPLTGDESVIFVEASWGLGSAVVSGAVTPDNWVVNKTTGEVVRATISAKGRRHRADPVAGTVLDEPVPLELRSAPSLSGEELAALVDIGRTVERHYGSPQDIEWAIAAPGPDGVPAAGLFLLQSRPETVRSGTESAPDARPQHARSTMW